MGRERKKAIRRAETYRREDCFFRRVAFIYAGITASAEDEQGCSQVSNTGIRQLLELRPVPMPSCC